MHVLRTNTDRERVSLRAITLGAVACLAAFTRADTYLFEQRSEPQGLFTATSVYVLDNTTTQTVNAVEATSGYSFAYWTVNGERATNVLGQSITQAPCLIVGTNVMAIAWYMSPSTDTDEDGNADFLELRIYGTLDHIGSDDTEGDGFTYAEELTRGYSPVVPDEPSDGGVMMRLSSAAATLRDESVKKRYEIRSDPQGIVTFQTGYVTTGTVVTTPSIPYGASSGYYFGYWEVNGVRQASGSGLALSSVAMTLTNDMIAIARFFSAGDSDEDGLADWRELYWFGALSLTPDDDPDADGFNIADELMRGYAVQVSDEPSDGGVMMRLSSAAIFSLAGVPLAHAGSNRLCQVGDTVNLDGQSSLNASNCLWRFLSTPAFSEASISNETSLTASFMPEVAGVYVIELVVGNGLAQSLPDTLTLTASPWPVVNLTVTSDFGSPWPSLGTHTYVGGTIITAAVQQVVNSGQTRYVCLGWTGTFSVPVLGTNAITRPFSLDRDSCLDWKWRTEYWLEGTVVGQGAIEGANRWVAAGTHANLSVTPSEGWLFIGWSDGLSGRRDLTSLDVAMDRPKRFVAHFSDDVDNDGLSNAQEISLGTDPWSTDSDNDGFGDAWEVGHNWNPTHPDNAVLAYIQGNASNFGLISSNQVGNLDSGSLAITISNNMVYLSLQIQASQNLLDWTNAGAPVIWSYPVQTNSSFFYRVQSRGL